MHLRAPTMEEIQRAQDGARKPPPPEGGEWVGTKGIEGFLKDWGTTGQSIPTA